MKKLFEECSIGLIASLIITCSYAQVKRAEIIVERSQVMHQILQIKCNVAIDENFKFDPGQRVFMIFLISYDSILPLKVGQLKQNESSNATFDPRFILIRERNLDVTGVLNLEPGRYHNLKVYPLLLQGDPAKLGRGLFLVNEEFSQIDDALDVFYKMKFVPLGYVEHRPNPAGRY